MRILKVLAVLGVVLSLMSWLSNLPVWANESFQELSYNLKPYLGIIHGHTGGPNGYDDGQWSVAQWAQWGIRNGLSFIILTPHANEIGSRQNEINGFFHYNGAVGYERFVKECQDNSNAQITIIPGVEFGDDFDNNSHFLVLGLYDIKKFNEGLKIYNSQGQKETIRYFNSWSDLTLHPMPTNRNFPIIAAHPDFDYRHFDTDGNVSDTKYQFDFNQLEFPDAIPSGLEVLNNGNVSTDTTWINLQHLLESVFSGRIRSITGGCDFHTDTAEALAVLNDTYLGERPFASALRRRTIVWSLSGGSQDILNAIYEGQTAAFYQIHDDINLSELPLGYTDTTYLSITSKGIMVKHKAMFYCLDEVEQLNRCWYKYSEYLRYPMEYNDYGSSQNSNNQVLDTINVGTSPNSDYPNNLTYLPYEYYILVLNMDDYYLVSSPVGSFNMLDTSIPVKVFASP